MPSLQVNLESFRCKVQCMFSWLYNFKAYEKLTTTPIYTPANCAKRVQEFPQIFFQMPDPLTVVKNLSCVTTFY